MSDGPRCAHLHVSYRTETVMFDGPDILSPPGSAVVPLRAGGQFTRGWWECDAGCGQRFVLHYTPVPIVEPVPDGMAVIDHGEGEEDL